MGHYDECVEISVDTGERFGGMLKGQYCLAEIRFDSSYPAAADPYTLNYDPKSSAWEKLKVRINESSIPVNGPAKEFVYSWKLGFLSSFFFCFLLLPKCG
jgi:hypothetical protein